MAPRTRNRQPLTDMEKKKKRQEYDKNRRMKMKEDPVLLEQLKRKEKEKYRNKLKKNQRKLVKNMTDREKRRQRKQWRQYADNAKAKKKENQSSPAQGEGTPTYRDLQCLRNSIKKQKALVKNGTERISILEDELKQLECRLKNKQTTIERLRKRDARIKQKASLTGSPASKVKILMERGTPKQIAKRALFAETITHALKKGYKALPSRREKNRFSSLMVNNSKYFRKYKIMNELNCISKKLFHMNQDHRSNNKQFRMKCNKLKTQVEDDVRRFFEDDDHSRLCPGKKDFVVKHKVKHQKRFLSRTLTDLHKIFCEKMPYRLSFATFCRLKPFWVVHVKVTERDTCVCRTHENMALLVKALVSNDMLYAKSVADILKGLCCEPSATACLLRNCDACRNSLISYKEFDTDSSIKYLQWNTVKEEIPLKNKQKKTVVHVAKQEISSTKFAVMDFLESQIVTYMKHEAVMIHQAKQFKTLKQSMTDNEVLIHCDFSENYAAKLSTEIQSFHFGGSRRQFTLHTVQVYYKTDANSSLKSQSLCTLSEVNDHGAHAIWAHMRPVLDFVFTHAPNVEIIHFQSDCPSTQYRNKTMFFLISHLFAEMDKIKTVTWNYSAPGHGKGAPDGVGGCLKRTADRVVAEGGDIIDFNDFIEALQKNTRNVILKTVNQRDIDQVSRQIPPSLPQFAGTMKVHQVVFNKSSPHLLKMRSLSCFRCLDCDDYLIGQLKTSKSLITLDDGLPPPLAENAIDEAHPLPSAEDSRSEIQPPPLEENSRTNQIPAPLLADHSRDDDGPSQPPEVSPTNDESSPSLAVTNSCRVGNFVLVLNGEPSSSMSPSPLRVCMIKSSSSTSKDHLMAYVLQPFDNSRRLFSIDLSEGIVKIRKSDVVQVMPTPTITIKDKRVIRGFPFDVAL